MPPSLVELSAKVDELTGQVDEKDKEHKDAMEHMDKEHKDAMHEMDEKHKADMDEKEKESKHAQDEEKEKHDAVLKAVLKAMEEDDKDKREALIKSAVEVPHKDDEHTQTGKKAEYENDEEKKAMKAQLAYQDNIIKKPKLQILQAAYEQHVDKSKLAEYTADWNKMTPQQLDSAIEKAQPVIELSGVKTTPEPIAMGKGYGTEFTGSINQEYSAKVDKMTDQELFA